MTVDQICRRVQKIADIAADDESAHAAEDGLWADVLLAIARGRLTGTDAKAAATAALETRKLSFSRWCA